MIFPDSSSCLGSKLPLTFTKRWPMNTYIPLIVTISTIIYTICSIELWGSSRDFPASGFQQSLGGTEPLSRDLTAARRSRNRFSAEGVGPDGGIHGRQPSGPRCRKERPSLRRISPKGLSLSVRKRSPCFENALGGTLGRAEKASLICSGCCADTWNYLNLA